MKLAASKATTAKILASVVLVGGAASVAGLGTFGAFTSTTTANQAVSSGSVTLDLSKPTPQGLETAAANMVPGDSIQRAVTLTRPSASELFGSVTLTTTSNGSILTDAGNANSLKLSIDSCTTDWVVDATKALTCGGVTTSVVKDATAVVANRALEGVTTALNSSTPQAKLRVMLTLPVAAGNEFQAKSDSILFTFNATQRAAKAL